MTEPTLGRRIMDAAEAYDLAAADLRGRTIPPREANSRANAALDRLRALAVRADAAERVAVAGDVYWGAIEAYDTSENEDDWDELLVGLKSRRVQLDNALAAWRALGEVDG